MVGRSLLSTLDSKRQSAIQLRTVEGHVDRIRMFERQMLGRADLDLLRKRVLLGD